MSCGDLCCYFCCAVRCSPARLASALAFAPPSATYSLAVLAPDNHADTKEKATVEVWGSRRSKKGPKPGLQYPVYHKKLDRHGSRARLRSAGEESHHIGAEKDRIADGSTPPSSSPSEDGSRRSSTAHQQIDVEITPQQRNDADDLMLEGLIDVGESHEWSTAVWRLLPGIQRVLLPKSSIAVTLAPRGKTIRSMSEYSHAAPSTARVHTSSNSIPVFSILYPGAYLTVLYCHGNAVDCGGIKDTLADISINARVNVVSFEYPGYGPARGHETPTEAALYADVEAVYVHLLTLPFCRSPEQVVIYGTSVGSGPACYLAAKSLSDSEQKPVAAGLILHSPIASGLRVLTANRLLSCFDIFPNVDRMPQIGALIKVVYIVHAQNDREVPVTHGEQLYQALPASVQRNAPPWFPEGAGHNDIIEVHREAYFRKLRSVLQTMAPRLGGSKSASGGEYSSYVSDPIVPPSRLSSVAAKLWSYPDSAPSGPGSVTPLEPSSPYLALFAAAAAPSATLRARTPSLSSSLLRSSLMGAAKEDDGDSGRVAKGSSDRHSWGSHR